MDHKLIITKTISLFLCKNKNSKLSLIELQIITTIIYEGIVYFGMSSNEICSRAHDAFLQNQIHKNIIVNNNLIVSYSLLNNDNKLSYLNIYNTICNILSN